VWAVLAAHVKRVWAVLAAHVKNLRVPDLFIPVYPDANVFRVGEATM
jgi:hypothetical protein